MLPSNRKIFEIWMKIERFREVFCDSLINAILVIILSEPCRAPQPTYLQEWEMMDSFYAVRVHIHKILIAVFWATDFNLQQSLWRNSSACLYIILFTLYNSSLKKLILFVLFRERNFRDELSCPSSLINLMVALGLQVKML